MPGGKKKQRSGRFGKLVFILPIAVLLALIIFGLFSNTTSSSGLLIVEAQSSYGGVSTPLSVMANVSGTSGETPFNLTLARGSYTVTYPSVQWYQTPPPRYVTVLGGKSTYALGSYVPTPDVVSVRPGGFNSSVTAKQGITPVVWVNDGSNSAQLLSPGIFDVVVGPGGSYSRVFSDTGNFTVELLGSNYRMQVLVI